MKKIMKHFLSLLVLSLIFVPMMTMAVGSPDVGIDETRAKIQLGEKSPVDTATTLVNFAMVFLGLIAVGIVLLAGFKWMTAGGNEDKISDAKKLMSSGVVGLVILLSAWGIASYVLSKAVDLTTTGNITQ